MKRNLLLSLFMVLLLLACRTSDEEKIRQVLQQRQDALRNRDLSLYLSCISKAYQDKEENFDHLQKRIGGYFRNFDRIEYQNSNVSILREGGTAVVTQDFELEVERQGQTKRYSGKEALFFRQEGREWKIIGGL